MTVDQVIQKAFLHAQRKPIAPTTGSTKYNALLGIADSMQKLWAAEPDTQWSSLYALASLTAVVSATDTFSLATAAGTIDYLGTHESDKIRITNGTNTSPYKLVEPNQLYRYKDSCVAAQIGANLKFSKAFDAASPLIGYTIQVPAYLTVPDITGGGATVVVDDPMWLAYMMAAEFVRNDSVRVGQYNNLLTLADLCMQKMKKNNGGALEEIDMPWQPAGATW